MQRPGQLVYRLKAPGRLHGQAFVDHRGQRTLISRRGGKAPGEHFVEQHAQGIDIRRRLGGREAILFRGGVARRTDEYRVLPFSRGNRLGRIEILLSCFARICLSPFA